MGVVGTRLILLSYQGGGQGLGVPLLPYTEHNDLS
jgi:hypothetical protein